MSRDDFSQKDKEILAKRVGYKCSICGRETTGPKHSGTGAITAGDAAHIKAASPGGPRYDELMSSKERKSINNGIWLCKDCAWKIDHDVDYYTVDKLLQIKSEAEYQQMNLLTIRRKDKSDKDVLNLLFKTYCDLKNSRYYFVKYYQNNFSSLSGSCEICNVVSKYWDSLYSSLFDELQQHNNYREALGNVLYSRSMEISDKLFSVLEDYLRGFIFSYSKDAVGLYNDYYGKFFTMIADNDSEQSRLEKKIDTIFKQTRNRL